MSRKYLLYLKDMQEACAKVQEFATGLSFDGFITRGMPYYSIIRLLEIIGEAAKNIPDEVRDRYKGARYVGMDVANRRPD